ncbi:MAG TPA: calcium-binding protein [Candidatus Dojkabacteria bacterium]|nr:calcium-binding protein [Candidatus Dojkabacteria bacterium]
MKSKIFKAIITIFLAAAVTISFVVIRQQQGLSQVKAIGDLTVDFGVPPGDPIFEVENLKPGDPAETRNIIVTNNASVIRPVGIRAEKTPESSIIDLTPALDLVISSSGTDLYGGGSPTGLKTMVDFFNETTPANGIELFNLNHGQTRTITITVTFMASAGNEFQSASVEFDIIIGIAFELPDECDDKDFAGPPIFGTQNNDTLVGTKNNDIIVGFEGNDVINAGSGNDCIIAGDGDDIVHGQNGDDVVFTGAGNDIVNGNNGNDTLFGEGGNDLIFGNNGNDFLDGGDGDDIIFGNNGDETVDGGEGNDILFGGNGNDTLNGEAGNDRIFGNSGNDILDGGEGMDYNDGGNGRDTCDAETEVRCEI